MDDIEVEVSDIIAEMDELGRAKFEAAHLAVVNKRLVKRIAELENGKDSVELADVVRLINAVEALILVPLCIYSIVQAHTIDQRLRFVSVLGLAVVIAGGQLATMGDPGNWRIYVLLLTMQITVVGVAWFLIRERQEQPRDRAL